MKKINFRGLNEVLSEKELKNVMGGSAGCVKCYCGGEHYAYYASFTDCYVVCNELGSSTVVGDC